MKLYQGSFIEGAGSVDVLENERRWVLDVNREGGVDRRIPQDGALVHSDAHDVTLALLLDALGDVDRAARLCPAFVGVVTAMSGWNSNWEISDSTIRGMAAFFEHGPEIYAVQ